MKFKKNTFQFLIARHGESIWNKENRFTGWTDIPITKNGIIQSNELAKTIIKNKIKPYCIFTSELNRAIHTSDIIQKKLKTNIDIHKSWRLNEKSYGDCEGVNRDSLVKHTSKDYVSELRRSFFMIPPKLDNEMKYDFEEYQLNTNNYYLKNKIYNGETKEMVLHRMLPYWYEEIIPKIKDHCCPLIITHKHTARVLLKYLTKMSLIEFDNLDFPNGKIHHIRLNDEFFIDNKEEDINILSS
jgi:2,3-bisphosphoglycerate-dependent phosphoglycerate mutase